MDNRYTQISQDMQRLLRLSAVDAVLRQDRLMQGPEATALLQAALRDLQVVQLQEPFLTPELARCANCQPRGGGDDSALVLCVWWACRRCGTNASV